MQGLITSDIRDLTTVKHQEFEFERVALYTLFLQSKGKIITDAFVVRPRMYTKEGGEWAEEQLWLDIPREAKGTLKEHLRRHSWKKKVQVVDTDAEMEVQGFKPLVYSGSVNVPSSRTRIIEWGSHCWEELSNLRRSRGGNRKPTPTWCTSTRGAHSSA